MKKMFIAAVMMMFSAVAFAADLCESSAGMAYSVMIARQNGVPLSKVLAVVPPDEPAASIVKDIVMQAYSTPRYSHEDNRVEAAENFRDTVHVACLKATM